jgi:GAF domain-containing protein
MINEPQTWRELLGWIMSDPEERQRLVEELGMRTITLSHWATGDSDPRPQNLHRLLDALPRYRETLYDLIREEYPDFSDLDTDDSSKEIPSEFYVRVFASLASNAPTLRFWSIGNLILQQALGQLDPDRLGMAVTVARCMPPSRGQKVRSLRESIGVGTSPWAGDLEQKAMFLGAESLAGYVATSCRPAVNQNIKDEPSLLPTHQVEGEISAAIYPILYGGRSAGCLLVSSTQPNHFHSQARLSLIQQYADLIAMAFEPEEFYEPQDIQLRIMPSHSIQKLYFADFRQRVANTLRDSIGTDRPLDNIEAEQLVWQQLEEELIELSIVLPVGER